MVAQEARGLDPDGLLLLDVVVSGGVPESLADADLQVQVGASPEDCRGGWGREWEERPQAPVLTPQRGAGAWPALSPVGGALGPASQEQVSPPLHRPEGPTCSRAPSARGRGERPAQALPPSS